MLLKKNKVIFMDFASGTPIDKSVLKAMNVFFSQKFFNPSSIYKEGIFVKSQLAFARENIANNISARPREIVFTDGGTEANNLVIRGLIFHWYKNKMEGIPHIITSSIEHASVLETCKDLEENGYAQVTYISVDSNGVVNIRELKNAIKENTILVSIGYVNGEIGVIQDIPSIAKTVRHYRKHNNSTLPYLHTDAVQATNFLDIHVGRLGIDFMTINGSKIYGPKKIAFLYKKANINIEPMITGGFQEFGLRAGTENIPYIIGLSKALSIASMRRASEFNRLKELQSYMENLLVKKIGALLIINGQGGERIPNIVNISIPGLSAEELVLRLDAKGIKVSMKSACKSGEDGDSHVITALRNYNTQSVRFSFGRGTKKKDIDYVVDTLVMIVRDMQAVRDMYGGK